MKILSDNKPFKLIPTEKEFLIDKTSLKTIHDNKSPVAYVPDNFTLEQALDMFVEVDESELLVVSEEEYQQMLEQSQGVE